MTFVKKTFFIILLLNLTSCGVKIKGLDNIKPEVNAKVGPDFEGAANFCDERYGYKTAESEACFEDYRDYFDVEVKLDVLSINKFCEEAYTDQEEIDTCIKDLIGVMTNKP
jgi:hypothetical protein